MIDLNLAFYLAGADPHMGHQLSRLKLSEDGLAGCDWFVFNAPHQHRIPVAVTMAGGYVHDIDTTLAVHSRTISKAARSAQTWLAVRHDARRAALRSMEQSPP